MKAEGKDNYRLVVEPEGRAGVVFVFVSGVLGRPGVQVPWAVWISFN